VKCLICRQESVDPELEVFVDDRWAAGVVEGYEVPGWIVLRSRRHVVGLGGLNAEDLATFGRRARDLSAAIVEAAGVEVTYLMIFGEANPHFHALLVPRAEDTPPDRRTGEILKLRYERADLDQARSLVPGIRAAYQHASSELLGAHT
jgi:diadenosine tetraphosphate (Ap4A) HIT family hydrolase